MENLDLFIRLLVASGLGLLIGFERTLAGKTAGMRTYALVSLASALFIVIGLVVNSTFLGKVNFDPMRTLAAIISGIGFIGAGLIVLRENFLRGLTSAAGLWVAAAVGAASGFGLYYLAAFTTLLTLFIFTAVWFVEHAVKVWWQNKIENKNLKQSSRRIASKDKLRNLK